MEIKIRQLTRKDRKTLTTLIRKLVDKIGSKGITNLIVSDPVLPDGETAKDSSDVVTGIGVALINQMIELLEDDVTVWFKDLTGTTDKSDDDLPFDFEANVINQLISSEEIKDFFTHALQAFNKMKEYAGQVKNEKTK
jgi:hypothetical protein